MGQVRRYSPKDTTVPPFLAQSNMLVKCGENGDVTDECVVIGGDTFVLNSFQFLREKVARNVVFEGITFQSGIDTFMELYNAGDITFRNCIFRVRM